MLTTLYEMFTSKKFIMAMAGVIVGAAGKIGLNLDDETVALLLSPIVAYILGQGWADTGKTAAKIEGVSVAKTKADKAEIKDM